MNTYYNNLYKPRPSFDELTVIKRAKDMNALLYDLLATRSPHGHEDKISVIIQKFLATNKIGCEVKKDEKGNLIIRNDKDARTMFSCHMDVVSSQRHGDNNTLFTTEDGYVYAGIDKEVYQFKSVKTNEVHTEDEIKSLAKANGFDYEHYTIMPRNTRRRIASVYGTDDMFQQAWTPCDGMDYQVNNGFETLPNVLGADDKLGCYIMCRLLQAKVPGLYVFHVGEECGGIGSSYIAKETPDVVKNIDYCVAFDRMDYTDIITNQSGGRCCSDEFADALAKQMNVKLPPKKQMSKSSGGTFTDSANYTRLIPECTNVSVGYKRQHTESEHFDHEWLERHLIPALLNVKWVSLPVKRDPSAIETFGRYSGGYRKRAWSLWGEDSDDYSASSPYTVKELFEKDETDNHRDTRRTPAQINQSAISKAWNQINDRMEEFEVYDGFDDEEKRSDKIERVMLTFYKKDMSLRDIAEMVVDAHEFEEDWGTGSFNKHYGG